MLGMSSEPSCHFGALKGRSGHLPQYVFERQVAVFCWCTRAKPCKAVCACVSTHLTLDLSFGPLWCDHVRKMYPGEAKAQQQEVQTQQQQQHDEANSCGHPKSPRPHLPWQITLPEAPAQAPRRLLSGLQVQRSERCLGVEQMPIFMSLC